MMKKWLHILLAVVFLTGSVLPPAMAQEVFLPAAQGIVNLSPAYNPCLLRGVKIDAANPFRFDFIVDKGDSAFAGNEFEEESQRLIKYFLATLTTPEDDLWVNLSPYESDRIIQDDFGRTAMGRDLLAQDYILKQITASLVYPDSDLGKKFWAEVYEKAYAQYGTTDIPVDTFNKVWIVPQTAVVYETRGAAAEKSLGAYVDEARLKVMLESDYLARSRAERQEARPGNDGSQEMAKEVVRQVILPALEKEVNEGKNFAQLRQVYHSLLLAVWLKKKLRSASAAVTADGKPQGHILSQIFIDQHKTAGVETSDPKGEITGIYDRYVEAFKKGAYNLIREDYDEYSQEMIPRKYFSGGFSVKGHIDEAMVTRDAAQFAGDGRADGEARVTVDLTEARAVQQTVRAEVQLEIKAEGKDAVIAGASYDSESAMGKVIYDQLFADFLSKPKENRELFPLLMVPVNWWTAFFAEAMQNALDSISARDAGAPQGNIVISARVVEGRDGSKEFTVSVRDNGVGLLGRTPEEVVTQGSTKDMPLYRYGVGVMKSRNFVQYMGGQYAIQDNQRDLGLPESGATVTARIPLDLTVTMIRQAVEALDVDKFSVRHSPLRAPAGGADAAQGSARRFSIGQVALITVVSFIILGPLEYWGIKKLVGPKDSLVKSVVSAVAGPSEGAIADSDMKTLEEEFKPTVEREGLSPDLLQEAQLSIREVSARVAAWETGRQLSEQEILGRMGLSLEEYTKLMFEIEPMMTNFDRYGFSSLEKKEIVLGLAYKESGFGLNQVEIKKGKERGRGILQYDKSEYFMDDVRRIAADPQWGPFVRAQWPELFGQKIDPAVVQNWMHDSRIHLTIAMFRMDRTMGDIAKVVQQPVVNKDAVSKISRGAVHTSMPRDVVCPVFKIYESRKASKALLAQATLLSWNVGGNRGHGFYHTVIQHIFLANSFDVKTVRDMKQMQTLFNAAEEKGYFSFATKRVYSYYGATFDDRFVLGPFFGEAWGNVFKASKAAGYEFPAYYKLETLVKEHDNWLKEHAPKKGVSSVKKPVQKSSPSKKKTSRDHAMAAPDNAQSNLGGIDLTPDQINMMIRGEGGNVRFDFTPQQLRMLEQNVSGFVPLIINVEPVQNVPMFLGLGERSAVSS